MDRAQVVYLEGYHTLPFRLICYFMTNIMQYTNANIKSGNYIRAIWQKRFMALVSVVSFASRTLRYLLSALVKLEIAIIIVNAKVIIYNI